MHSARLPRLLTTLPLAGAIACGGGGDAGTGGETGGDAATAATPPAAVADAGTIRGTISFTGTPPAPEPIDMSAEPDCASAYSEAPTAETVLADDGTLANVFVYIREGLTGSFGPSSEVVNINQEGCRYIPHVVGVQTGQPFTFQNSDGLLHNVKANPTANRPFNMSQPNDMTSSERTFNAAEIMVPVVCDVHGWMNMYMGVVEHPYFSVSSDDGTFEIGNVPPGTYTVEAWHERYGTQTMEVTVAPNGEATADFAYSESMAATAVVPLGAPYDPHDHTDPRVTRTGDR